MLTLSSRKSLACVEVVIEFERDDLIGRHTDLQQIVPEKDTEQVGFAAAPDTGDDFDLTVTAVGNQALRLRVRSMSIWLSDKRDRFVRRFLTEQRRSI